MNEEEKKKECLIRQLGVFELRGVARQLGVPSPTTKKREELISLILEATRNGNNSDDFMPKRGRPFKKLNILDSITDKITPIKGKTDFDSVIRFEQEYFPEDSAGDSVYRFEGILRKSENSARLYDAKSNVLVYLNYDIDNFSKAVSGDKLLVEAKELLDEDAYVALRILEINGKDSDNYTCEEEVYGEEIIDERSLPFGNSTIMLGRRNIHLLKEDVYENDSFDEFYEYCYLNNFHLIVLGVNTSFENQIKFKNLALEDNFTTAYASNNDLNLNKIIDAILYANRLVAMGEQVVLFVPDVIEILNTLDDYYGLDAGQVHSPKTIVIAQKLLSFARSYSNDRSGTLFMCYNEIDKTDRFLLDDILKISKKV